MELGRYVLRNKESIFCQFFFDVWMDFEWFLPIVTRSSCGWHARAKFGLWEHFPSFSSFSHERDREVLTKSSLISKMMLPVKSEVSPEEADDESGLREVEKVIFFPMHPMHSIQMQEGIDEGLESLLLKYYPRWGSSTCTSTTRTSCIASVIFPVSFFRVHGIPISYKKLGVQSYGTILPSGMIQVAVKVKFQVFAVRSDQVLVGMLT